MLKLQKVKAAKKLDKKSLQSLLSKMSIEANSLLSFEDNMRDYLQELQEGSEVDVSKDVQNLLVKCRKVFPVFKDFDKDLSALHKKLLGW